MNSSLIVCDTSAQLSLSQRTCNREREREKEVFLYFFKTRLNNNNNNNNKREEEEETLENVTESDIEELDEKDLTLTRDFEGISLDSETNTTANLTDQEGVS